MKPHHPSMVFLRFSNIVELKFRDAGFAESGKTGEPREKPSEQGENQENTQPTYDTVPESNPRHIGGRRALSLPRHLYSP